MKDGTARRAGVEELELRLLGPLEASRGGHGVSLGGPKPRALLALLALDLGRVVSVDTLVEELWPGAPPETAAHAVQVYVSQLRKALGAHALPRRGPGYALDVDPGHVDVTRFAQLVEHGREALAAENPGDADGLLREALGLWRGPALVDFVYEPFAQTEIARLEELRTVALEERIEADLALGRHAELVSELEALVEVQPLRERPRAQLMLALYRSGRQADALAAYRNARETLVGELGVEPGPELKGLEAAILRQDESLELVDEAAPRPAMQYRRLVTILFAELVDSIAFAERLDPEALGRVLQQYVDTVAAAVERHGGSVESAAASEVMAVFGTPVAHEDDALRGARAAIDIQAGIAALHERVVAEHEVALATKVGLAASEVVTTTTDGRRRLVAGDAVGIASRIRHAAGAGEVVVGEVVARLIDHAARLEPYGALEIEGRNERFELFRLLEIIPAAPAFQRRLDAPFAGRRKELGALRKALRTAISEERARAVTVIGSPGVGKSRLASEIASRAKNVHSLFGRCLSYGDGITYWPLREALQQLEPGRERDAILAALDGEPPPPAPEIALAFRKVCETLARGRPLVLVFDDIQWGEPTFLDLVEHLVDKGKGPILVLCIAREELLEERAGFLLERDNAQRLVLDTLSAAETEALLDGLGGSVLESGQRTRITDAAEGNPLFLEQLLALALEGGLAEDQVPETVQALLAARLDRLGPGERAVLERGSVIGKQFRLDDVTALVEAEAVTTVETHVKTLVGRGFVRPAGADSFGFRHGLVQEAVYRATPKRLRAELHERFADRLERRDGDLADPDEFVGYHLEQAYRLRAELGGADRHTEQLAEDAGRRLGAAGMRAIRRGDMPTTVSLLQRACSLLLPEDARHRELLSELAIAEHAAQRSSIALELLAQAAAESESAGDSRAAARARIEIEYIRLRTEAGRTADDLVAATRAGIPIFEAVDDQRALGRAWLLDGWVRGGRRCDHRAWEEGASRALVCYRATRWPTSTCIGELAAALYWGPTPVGEAITRCASLVRDQADRLSDAYVSTFLGGLVAQQGDFERGRAFVESARATFEELGLKATVTTYCTPVSSEIEILADDVEVAERILHDLCDELRASHQYSRLASAASELADVLISLGAFEDADEWSTLVEPHIAADDLHAQVRWLPVRAKVHARRGDHATALDLARDAIARTEATDDLNRQAKAQADFAHVLRQTGGSSDDVAGAFDRASQLFLAKGNVTGAARIRSLEEGVALV